MSSPDVHVIRDGLTEQYLTGKIDLESYQQGLNDHPLPKAEIRALLAPEGEYADLMSLARDLARVDNPFVRFSDKIASLLRF